MTVLFGVPNRGSVCSEKHLPGYMKELDKLRQQGVTQILCVSVGDRDTVYEWGKNVCPSGDILVAADPMGKLTRLFGMELDPEASPGNLTSMRYAMALDDGIILKVVCFHAMLYNGKMMVGCWGIGTYHDCGKLLRQMMDAYYYIYFYHDPATLRRNWRSRLVM